jgi:hypothetical protein
MNQKSKNGTIKVLSNWGDLETHLGKNLKQTTQIQDIDIFLSSIYVEYQK